jgi:hypothetical protein
MNKTRRMRKEKKEKKEKKKEMGANPGGFAPRHIAEAICD